MCNIYAIVGGVQLYWWCIWAGCARCTPSKSATSETNRFLGKASLYILFCNFMRLILCAWPIIALNGLIEEINQLDPSFSLVERQTINIDKAGIMYNGSDNNEELEIYEGLSV